MEPFVVNEEDKKENMQGGLGLGVRWQVLSKISKPLVSRPTSQEVATDVRPKSNDEQGLVVQTGTQAMAGAVDCIARTNVFSLLIQVQRNTKMTGHKRATLLSDKRDSNETPTLPTLLVITLDHLKTAPERLDEGDFPRECESPRICGLKDVDIEFNKTLNLSIFEQCEHII
nr:hypothetical protein [Tanacetum cinerariifolium]